MTVRQLIDELTRIENKDLEVSLHQAGDAAGETCTEIQVQEPYGYVLLCFDEDPWLGDDEE